jgi:hypothetical protein
MCNLYDLVMDAMFCVLQCVNERQLKFMGITIVLPLSWVNFLNL